MTNRRNLLRSALALTLPVALTLGVAGIPAQAANITTLKFQTDNSANSIAWANGLVKAYMKVHRSVKIVVEIRPGGGDGDNVVKTRLATGTMDDIFFYNSGSLFQAINPVRNLVDLTDQPWQKNILSSFKSAVSAKGKVYGAPAGTAMGGGMVYNRTVFATAGITSVPKTWNDLIADCAKIKAIGVDCVEQTYGDAWPAQILVLADFFNVQAADPSFAVQYTANKAKFATTPAAMAAFEHLQQLHDLGYFNADYTTATLAQGLTALTSGKAAIYPMLTFVGATIDSQYPAIAKNIGFFAEPGASASSNGVTTWMPGSLYIPKKSKKINAAKAFVAWVNSPAGIAAQTASSAPSGPYLVKGAVLPANRDQIAKDLEAYFKKDGTTAPALEFLSAVKGPNLDKITVQAGTGQLTGAAAAAAYDQDVLAQAQQLGLPGWK